jgi:hypothetical protein
VTKPRTSLLEKLVRTLILVVGVALGLLVALFVFLNTWPRSIVTIRNADPTAIESCRILVQSEFWFDQVREVGRVSPGSMVTLDFGRLSESNFVFTCRFADGPARRGATGNFWDSSPGDTLVFELRRSGWTFQAPNRGPTWGEEWGGP